jgi:hypothetical protein
MLKKEVATNLVTDNIEQNIASKALPIDNAKVAETTITDAEWTQAETAHERFKARYKKMLEDMS